MLNAFRASALMLVLCACAFAGDIPNPSTPSPPNTSAAAEPTEGETQDGATDALTEALLAVIGGVLPLL